MKDGFVGLRLLAGFVGLEEGLEGRLGIDASDSLQMHIRDTVSISRPRQPGPCSAST